MFAFGACKPGVTSAFFDGLTMTAWVISLPEKASALGKALLTNPVGQQTVVTNAHKSFWQAVQQDPPDELGGIQAHCPLAVAATVIFIAKADLSILHANQPPVGYGHTVGIPGQILEYPLR